MPGLDDAIAGLAGGGLLVVLLVALLLGLRHATDPDHLTAVSTLILSEPGRDGAKRARKLGLAWGAGHATTVVLFGLPIVLFQAYLPEHVQQGAELAVGLVIIGLSVRLLVRWKRGYFHIHAHQHGEVTHAHPHVHEHGPQRAHAQDHQHGHAESLGRTPRAAFGIGLIHGVGGSAGFGILLLAAIPGRLAAVAALVIFAGGTALSMALVSWGLGAALTLRGLEHRIGTLAPGFGLLGLAFGAWYAAAALL